MEKIASALNVSAVELLTGDSPIVEDTEETKQLRKRVEEVENRLKDKEDIIAFKDWQFEAITKQYTKYLYGIIAEKAFEKGYSRIRIFERKTGKTIRYVTWEDYSGRITYDTIGDLIHTFVDYHTADIIKNQANKDIKEYWDMDFDVIIISEHRQQAVNYYFSQLIGGGFDDEIKLNMESGVIKDEMLLIAYNKAKSFEEEGFEDDEEVDDNLELVKINPK